MQPITAGDAIVRTLHALVGYGLFATDGRAWPSCCSATVSRPLATDDCAGRRVPRGGGRMKDDRRTAGRSRQPLPLAGPPTTSRWSGRGSR